MTANKSKMAQPTDQQLAHLYYRHFGDGWTFGENQRTYANAVVRLTIELAPSATPAYEPTDDQLEGLFHRYIGNGWAFTAPQLGYARAVVKLTLQGAAAAGIENPFGFNFTIDPPGKAPRVKRWLNGSSQPATVEECAMWDALQTRAWPEGAVFTDGEGSFFDEQAEPLAPAGALAMSDSFRQTVAARPLAYSLDDYWQAPSGTGPLGFTWKDKPHRVVYDLLAALRFYTDGGQAGVQRQLARHFAESPRYSVEGALDAATRASAGAGKEGAR